MGKLRERKWPTVIATPITVSGDQLILPDTSGLHPKTQITLYAPGQPDLELEVKRVLGPTAIQVGPDPRSTPASTARGRPIGIDTIMVVPSGYTGGTLEAKEQPRTSISSEAIFASVFAEEPTVALRVNFVDYWGDQYSNTNPLPIIFDGTVNVGNVRVTEYDNDPLPGDVHSSIRVGDGVNDVKVNNDGSLNVIIKNNLSTDIVVNRYNPISSVPASSPTTVLTYIVPALRQLALSRIEVGGTNIAIYTVTLNSVPIATQITWWAPGISGVMDFESQGQGLLLVAGDTIAVSVTHTRPFLGDFYARLSGTLIT